MSMPETPVKAIAHCLPQGLPRDAHMLHAKVTESTQKDVEDLKRQVDDLKREVKRLSASQDAPKPPKLPSLRGGGS